MDGQEWRRKDRDRGPGESVILVSRVTQGPGLPDGALEGLAKAALGHASKDPQTDSIPLFSHKCKNGRVTHSLSLSFSKSHIKHTSCDVVLNSKCNLNRPGNVGQRPHNIWRACQEFKNIKSTQRGVDRDQGRGHYSSR